VFRILFSTLEGCPGILEDAGACFSPSARHLLRIFTTFKDSQRLLRILVSLRWDFGQSETSSKKRATIRTEIPTPPTPPPTSSAPGGKKEREGKKTGKEEDKKNEKEEGE